MRRSVLLALLVLAAPALAYANGHARMLFPLEHGCDTCHETSGGGGGPGCHGPEWCLNPFGLEVQDRIAASLPVWDAALASLDTAGAGYTNGEELGDLDADGRRDDPGWPERSPGIQDGDMDECLTSIADCDPVLERCRNQTVSSPAARPSFACECSPDARPGPGGECLAPCPSGFEEVDGECVPGCLPGYSRRDGRCHRTYSFPAVQLLPDAVWVDVQRDHAHASVWESACATAADGRIGGSAVLFDYAEDCPDGDVLVESDSGAVLALTTSMLGNERDCAVGSIFLPMESVNPVRVRVRVHGGGRVRATCRPGVSASVPISSRAAPTCSTAVPVGEGTHSLALGDYHFAPQFPPGDVCGVDLYGDLWLEHVAACEGRLHVSTANTDWCFVHEEHLALYAGSDCPERDDPLDCDDFSQDRDILHDPFCEETEDGAFVAASVRRGERVLIRVTAAGRGGYGLGEELTITCDPRPRCDDASICDPAATCSIVDDTFRCECPDNFEGDGIPVERGGTGCTFLDEPECDLPCDENGTCYERWESEAEWRRRLADDPDSDPGFLRVPYCTCNEGYRGSGFDCVVLNECAEAMDDCPFHSQCIDETPGYRCECETGYQPNPLSDELECVIVCGDGERAPGEHCDDGNTRDGDGCDTHCEIEPTFRCLQNHPPASNCVSTCDDGFIDEDDHLCDAGDDDCNCSAPGATKGRPFAPVGLILLGLLLWRRRRTARQHGDASNPA